MNSKYCSREPEALHQLLGQVAHKLATYLAQNYDRESIPVCHLLPPTELRKQIDFTLPDEGMKLGPNLADNGVEDLVDKILKYCTRTGSPRYFYSLWCGMDISSLIGEFITTTTNTSVHTYDISPVYTLMELELVQRLLGFVGWSPEKSDGLFVPGGSHANLFAMVCARRTRFPESGVSGFGAAVTGGAVAFSSAHAHFSIARNAMLIGLGSANVRSVPVDSTGHMRPESLEEMLQAAVEKGEQPFFVNATAGTTVLGAYDPLRELARVCKKYGVWLHVDAAWGGGVALSPERKKRLMDGLEESDSIGWCLHKMIGMSLQCSVCLIKDRQVLRDNATHASYLFHYDENDDAADYDLGAKSLMCSRRQDVLKLWFSWKVNGTFGFQERVEICFQNTQYLVEQIRARPERFELMFVPECLNVCFMYYPKCVRNLEKGKQKDDMLHVLTVKIRRKMQEKGSLLVNYQPMSACPPYFPALPNFFRIILSNPETTHEDLDFFLNEIETVGQDMTI